MLQCQSDKDQMHPNQGKMKDDSHPYICRSLHQEYGNERKQTADRHQAE